MKVSRPLIRWSDRTYGVLLSIGLEYAIVYVLLISARGLQRSGLQRSRQETFALEGGRTYQLPVVQFIAVEYKIATKSSCKRLVFFVRGLLDEGLPACSFGETFH